MYEREILEIYKYCGIKSFPVDCQKIADTIGYQIRTYQETAKSHEELVAMKKVSNDAYVIRKNKTIYVNNNVMDRRKLFSLAHELGHIILLTDDEEICNSFASSFLAPRPIVYAKNLKTADDISAFFGISTAAANNVVLSMSSYRHYYFPKQSELDLIEYFGYKHEVPSLFLNSSRATEGPSMPMLIHMLKNEPEPPTKDEEQEKKKKIRSIKGKILRLQAKLATTKDEVEWYKAKDKLAEQQMRLDMLLGKDLDDY